MSQGKINGKNLHYDQSLPPFLARLRGQATVDSQSPDPILAARRRPAKQRSGSEEAEDAPLVVNESGIVVSTVKVEWDGTVKDLKNNLDGNETVKGIATAGGDGEDRQSQNADASTERVAGIGGGRKRKVGKIVGGDVEDQEDDARDDAYSRKVQSNSKAKAIQSVDADARKLDMQKPGKPTNQGKKKAKKIKLSFGDDEQGG